MGNLLKILACKEESSREIDFFVDFENARPGETEEVVWQQVQAVLAKASGHIHSLTGYISAADDIKSAIEKPREERLQDQAWLSVSRSAALLKQFYLFSADIAEASTTLLAALTSTNLSPRQHLESQQALVKQLADVVEFTLSFDDLKMSNPAIQNDFSYYRRQLGKRGSRGTALEVDNTLANKMSLFYAAPTPMLKALSEATTSFVQTHSEQPVSNTTDCLCTMAEICRVMIENQQFRSRFASGETLMFCLRVMVGVIILVDHVHPDGAFCKTSGINVKSCVKLVKEWEQGPVEGLLNALRYSTKHLQDESTPKHIRQQLGV